MQPYLWNTFLPHLPLPLFKNDFNLLHVTLCNLHIPVTSTTKLWVFLCSLEMDIKVTYICLNKTKHLQVLVWTKPITFNFPFWGVLSHWPAQVLSACTRHAYIHSHAWPRGYAYKPLHPSVHQLFVFTSVHRVLNWIHHLISHQVSNITSFELLLNSAWNQRVKDK